MQDFDRYLFLLQVSAVTVVACVFILGVSAELFAFDQTGLVEPGGNRPIFALRYRGRIAATCRHMVFLVGAVLAAAYSGFLPAVIASAIIKPGLFDIRVLTGFLIFIICITILAVCWIVFLAILLRWIKMRRMEPPVLL